MVHLGKPPCDDAQVLHGPAVDAPCSPAQRRWVLAATILGSSMAFVDGTVVNVALPAIQRSLKANAFDAQWVVESYALLLAALLLVGGVLGDRFGRRRMFVLGTAVFTLASLGCAMSGDVQVLILARAVQGVGAALLVPGSLALISASFPQNERGRAIGTWSGFSGITAALGPVLGGWLIDHYSWHWAFLINLPLGAAVLAIAIARVPESRSREGGALDPVGALLATLGLGGVVYAFIEAPVQHWHSPRVLAALVLGVAALAAFLVMESRARAPMLPLRLFRNRDFAGTNALTLMLYAALGGGLFFFPLALIQVHGYSATQAGAALLPFIFTMFLLSRWAGRLVDRYGAKRPLVIGPSIAAAGFALFMLPGAVSPGYAQSFLPAVLVLGLGMTITVSPLTTTVMNSVGADMAGVASGVNNAVSRVAALLAIAVFGLVMAWAFGETLSGRLAALDASREVLDYYAAQRDRLAAAGVPAHVDASLAEALKHAVGEAFISGFRWVMALCAGLALASAASAWALVGDARR